MKAYLIAERYARGLDRALEDGADRDAAAAALQAIAALYSEHHDLQTALSHPGIPAEERAALLAAVLERTSAPERVRKLLDTLLRRGRIALLADVATLFSHMTDERMNRAGAQITTAITPAGEQADRLVAALETFSGRTVRADFQVDPDILGGAVARIEGKVIDGSLRARIQRLRHHLLPEENLGG